MLCSVKTFFRVGYPGWVIKTQAKWIDCELFLAFSLRFLELALSYRVASGEMRFVELSSSERRDAFLRASVELSSSERRDAFLRASVSFSNLHNFN